MDDDRLALARRGDLDAFLDLVRPHTGRLVRLARAAAGAGSAGDVAAAAALRSAWRASRRLPPAAALGGDLEARLVSALPRRPRTASASPLAAALAGLSPADRVALARCLDPAPDAAALAIAGRAGVEIDHDRAASISGVGTIVDLDGPLAGWDLAGLRTALAHAAGEVDADVFLERLCDELRTVQPDPGWRAALRTAIANTGTLGRAGAAAVVVVAVVAFVAGSGSLPGGSTGTPGADAGGAPAGAGGDAAAGDGGAGSPLGGAAVAFPAVIDGYPVIPVDTALGPVRDRAAGRALAIRGWLTGPQMRGLCAKPDVPPGQGFVSDPLAPEAAFCQREAVLLATPAGGPGATPHLHPQLLPGTGLGGASAALAVAEGRAVPVVLLAHFDDPVAPCTAADRRCREEVVVDRIPWVAGQAIDPPAAVRPIPGDPAPRRTPTDVISLVEGAFGRLRTDSVAGVPASDLGRLEPAAAASATGTDYAWLVRATIDNPAPGDRPGAVRTWFVVDDATGAITAAPGVLARARAGDAFGLGGAALGGVFPKRVGGSLVRTVAEVRVLAEADVPPATAVAVAGWLVAPSLPIVSPGATAPDCLAGDRAAPGRPAGLAGCRRTALLTDADPGVSGLALQLPPGVPVFPTDAQEMPLPGIAWPAAIPVVALVELGSSRAWPCDTDQGPCDPAFVVDRLLWVDGMATGAPATVLRAPSGSTPRQSLTRVRALARDAVAHDGAQVVSIVGVPAAELRLVEPGADERSVTGAYAWIVRARTVGSPMDGVDAMWWLVVDDATGRVVRAAIPAPAPGALVPGR